MPRLSALVLGSVLTCAPPLGCVYDPDHRCGPHQRPGPAADQCVCEDGYVREPEGCVACGEHERDSNGACACVGGFARRVDGAACEEAASDEPYRPRTASFDPRSTFSADYRRDLAPPTWAWSAGANVRPTPNVVLKAELSIATCTGVGSTGLGADDLPYIGTQAAWAF